MGDASVQLLLGVHSRVARENADDPDGANGRSVLVELQADCFAGVWLHTVAQRGRLSDADLEDILRAAAVVGDDFQRQAAGARARAGDVDPWVVGTANPLAPGGLPHRRPRAVRHVQRGGLTLRRGV
jgi:predicted metalloprotease